MEECAKTCCVGLFICESVLYILEICVWVCVRVVFVCVLEVESMDSSFIVWMKCEVQFYDLNDDPGTGRTR